MAGNGNAWPKEDAALLTNLVKLGIEWSIIAKAIGKNKTAKQCKHKWERIKYYDSPKPDVVYTERICLDCQRPFQSEGVKNRVCTPCKKTEKWGAYRG